MKSFAVKRDEKDPRWEKFIEWGNGQGGENWSGNSPVCPYYGFNKDGYWDFSDQSELFDSILTLDEWEAEFMQPKLAGRKYDEMLLNEFKHFYGNRTLTGLEAYKEFDSEFKQFLNQRYAKPDRIAEIKAEMEKLSNELKELENGI